MRRLHLLFVVLLAGMCTLPLRGQTPAAIRIQTDSLRAETCRGGTLTGGACKGRKLTLRLTAVRRFAARIDSIVTAPVSGGGPIVPPKDTLVSPPRDSVPPQDSVVPPPKDSTPSTPPSTPPAPVDTLRPPAPVPPPTPSTGVELPRAVPTWPAALETATCTQIVTSGLQAALSSARAGDVLCLSGTFSGNYRFPQRTDSGWVVVRSVVESVGPGIRQRPSLAGALARLQGLGTAPTLAITGAGWYVRSLDIAAESTTTVISTIVNITGARVVLDRVWVHPPTDRSIQRCVAANGADAAVVNSWLGECHGKGFDSQAFWSYNGTGPFLLDNNTLEGAGENIMFGGADPTIAGLIPSDITITRNHIVTPVSWKGRWTKKNLFEIKNAQRVLVQGNVFEGSWSDAQTGFAFILKVANQGGGCRWCTMADVTVRENLIVRVGAVFGVTAKDPGVVDSLGRRIVIERNYADSVNVGAYLGASQLLAVMNDVTGLIVRQNTLLGPTKNDVVVATNPAATGATITGNVFTRATYPLHGCAGPILPCFPGSQFAGNVFLGAAIAGAPPGITSAPSLAAALTLGAGIDRAVIDAAVRGVVVQP